MKSFRKQKLWIILVFGLLSISVSAQCNGSWEQVVFESFEYSTVIPGVVPGSIYHNTPQSFASGVHSGSNHMYLNFVNGYTGPAYDRSFNVCAGSTVRFSFWFKDTWGASNNIDVNVYDGNNVLLETTNYNISNNNSWTQFVSNEITVTTAQIRLEVVNLLTVGNNDLTMDDLAVEVCSETVSTLTESICDNKDLKEFLPTIALGGTWSGPSALTNADLGTFTLNSNIFGTYNYLIGGVNPCPSENYEIILSEEFGPDAGEDANAFYCTGTTGSDLFGFVNTSDQTGNWNGPSALLNGFQGSFDPGSNVAGIYEYAVLSSNSCPNDTARVQVSMGGNSIVLGNDTTICQGETLTIDAGPGHDSYLWSTNETTQSIDVLTAGTYSVQVGSLGGNLVQNPGFEQGDVGFSTDYTPGVGGPWGQLSNPGTYAIDASPSNVHTLMNPCGDHTSGAGNFFMVNGSATAGLNAWCQTFPVQPNTDYEFSAWVTSIAADNPAVLQFSINGATLGSSFNAPGLVCDWQEFFQLWNSGANTTATICVLSQSISSGGNDYGIDDISFRPVCMAQDEIEVAVQTLPIVDLGIDQAICETSSITLDAGNSGMSYLWQDNSTNQTLSTATAGDYSVTVTDAFNCSASGQMTLSVETLSNAGQDNNDIVCESNSTFDMNDMVDANGSLGDWEIMSGTPNFNAGTGVVQLLGAESFQILNIVTGIECPNDTAFYDVQVEIQPDAGANNNLKLCNDSIIDISNLLEAGVSGGNWIELINSNQFNINSGTFNTNGLAGGVYSFEYEITAELPCLNDKALISIEVVEMPKPSFSLDEPIGCVDHTVQFSDLSSGSGNTNCNWNFGDNTNSPSCGSVSHTYTSPGVYDVTYSITNDNLCYDEFIMTNAVEVVPNPNAFFTFGPSTIFSSEPEVTFTNGSSFADSYTWDFGDGSGISSNENPTHSYPELVAGVYSVELDVQNSLGCSDVYMLDVTVVDEIIFYVPNAFTPDEDNYNPVFRPVMTSGFQTDTYQLEVFNRWGELVFISNDTNTGWDGTYKGKLVQDGTYVWKIYFKEQFNDKKHEHIGQVTLIR